MNDPTHAPGWRGRPASYVDLRDRADANPFEIFCYFGCAIGAAICLGAAAYVWTPAIAQWIAAL